MTGIIERIRTAPIQEAALETLPVTAAAAANSIDLTNPPQSVAVDSALLDLSAITDPTVRSGLSLSLLFASRRTAAENVTDADQWLASYLSELGQVGFQIAGVATSTSRLRRVDVGLHKAIVPFLTIALGGATVGPVLLALLNNLDSMNPDSPWITLFSSEAKRFGVQEMHFGAAIPAGANVEIRYVVTRFDLQLDDVNFLFFKITNDVAQFESRTTTVSANNGLLSAVEGDLRTRLESMIKHRIWEAKLAN